MLKKVLFLIFVICFDGISGKNYCDQCSEHTMCIYKEVGPACKPLLSSKISKEQTKEIVDTHNNCRQKVASGSESGQPSASNMRILVWDAELAKIAQRWANQCSFGHDQCRDVKRFSVGQNAYIKMTTASNDEPNWKEAIMGWYDEVKDFNRNNISPFRLASGPATGHYTQVVWAETTTVGCGYAKFMERNSKWYNLYYICNYGPAGNMIGGDMYKQGKACSQCPKKSSCRDSLCA